MPACAMTNTAACGMFPTTASTMFHTQHLTPHKSNIPQPQEALSACLLGSFSFILSLLFANHAMCRSTHAHAYARTHTCTHLHHLLHMFCRLPIVVVL